MKKDRRFEKSVRFLAAAALSAALLGSQLPVVLAAENSVESASGIKSEDLFPDNITVTDPVSLAEVGFPDNKYGKLKWVDDSIELTEHVQSCEAVFVPEEGIDLTDMEGWDKELGGVVSHIHVIVSSIAGDDMDEETGELEETEESQETESEDMDAVEEETSGEWEDEKEDTGVSDENEADTEETSEESADENADAEILPEDGESEEENSEDSAESDSTEAGGADGQEDNGEVPEEESSQNNSADKDETGAVEEVPDQEEPGSEGNDSNIFDDPEDFDEEDERPTELPESLTEEEKLQHAIMNHSCEGISVSGINLPWYVQFRVTSGESYEFANESEAEIFKSYEFELWDLQNNTEYEIPDGEYISVTVPVKEGYDYTVEHLLDNGATETIVPSVEGGVMVFSTHSFSPFGIAGSMQMVGPDFPIGDDVKPTVTPTPSVTGKPGENGTSGNNGGTNTGSGTNNGGSNGTGGVGNSTGISGNGSDSGQNVTSGNSVAGDSTGISGNGSNFGQNGASGNNGVTGNNANGQNSSQSSGSHAVETGDTTAILPFVALVLAAVILIGAVIYLKTKKK